MNTTLRASALLLTLLAAACAKPAPYDIIIEHGPSNFGAYAPDFPGCVAAADTEAETIALMKEALEMHIEDMRQRGETIPQPSEVREVEIAA